MYASKQYLTRRKEEAATGKGSRTSSSAVRSTVQRDRIIELQRAFGNREVARLIQARRLARSGSASRREGADGAEAMEDGQPDWSAPIEQEADTRSEGVSGLRAEVGPATVQRQAAPPAAAFPTFPQVRWNATVSNAMWAAWVETVRAANAATRREQGFWVQWDNTTVRNANGTMRVVGAVTAPLVGPTVGASVQLGARPADAGNWVTVASFHTHTPTRFRPVGRVVGPSADDHAVDTSDNVTGLVYDYTAVAGGAIPAGHPLWSDSQVYHSGPASRA
jgi:hypothetical protein